MRLDPTHIHFATSEDILLYQQQRFKALLSAHKMKRARYESFDETERLPIAKARWVWAANLRTSGTLTGIPRNYHYSRRQLFAIQDYHYRRILHFAGIENNGRAVIIAPFTQRDPRLGLVGPFKFIELGVRTKVWKLQYAHFNSAEKWRKYFDQVRELSPSVIYCRPSEFDLFKTDIGALPIPILFTGETLYPHQRAHAATLFPKVINKMRCWDGGLSFFECEYGRLHINDELCIVQSLRENELASTDLFNFSQPFIKYKTGDRGTIEQGECTCGIFGNYFSMFDGRVFESIFSASGRRFSAVFLMSMFQSTLASLTSEPTPFQIIQQEDRSLQLHLPAGTTDELCTALKLRLLHLVNDSVEASVEVQVHKEPTVHTHGSKRLLVRTFVNDVR